MQMNSTIDEKEDCVVTFDDILENKWKDVLLFSAEVGMKTLICISFYNDISSGRYKF